jgi:hypothetical protein
MSADQHKQIGIWHGATSFNMRTVFINGNFGKSKKLKGRSEKFKNFRETDTLIFESMVSRLRVATLRYAA